MFRKLIISALFIGATLTATADSRDPLQLGILPSATSIKLTSADLQIPTNAVQSYECEQEAWERYRQCRDDCDVNNSYWEVQNCFAGCDRNYTIELGYCNS